MEGLNFDFEEYLTLYLTLKEEFGNDADKIDELECTFNKFLKLVSDHYFNKKDAEAKYMPFYYYKGKYIEEIRRNRYDKP